MKKYTIMTLVMLVLFSTCVDSIGSDLLRDKNGNGTEQDISDIEDESSLDDKTGQSAPTDIRIKIEIYGNDEGDNVTSLTEYGKAGAEITLNYTLAGIKQNNRLAFSGTDPVIDEVGNAGSGKRKYVIAEKDAVEGVIKIIAAFTHSNKILDTIAFADTSNEEKVYGNSFTKTITNTGSGSGAISYESSDTSVAAVNNSGTVTIRKVGTTTITAVKAADTVYEKAEAMYTLTVTPLQLTIAAPTFKPKVYDGTTAADVTVGALTNKVSGDTVTVTAVANFNSADYANANTITVVYAISGASAGNYIPPVDSVIAGRISSKAQGAAVNTNPTAQLKTATSITSSVVTAGTKQSVEYAISTSASPVPTDGWKDGLVFDGLTPNTDYYIFARAKENDNYLSGTAKVSSKITTDASSITIKITMAGNSTGDSVTATPASGKAGTEITLNYTLANLNANNRLAFSGTTTAIETVNNAGSGTRKYIINEKDADQNTITINATFTHAALVLDTIAFANTSNEDKVYGSASFTKAITNTGSGTGAISYASSDKTVATVDVTSGAVTIVKTGSTTITATKAADATYAQATASYTLTVNKLQLTIENPTVTTTKVYKSGDTTAAVTAGALTNKVGSDTVTVTAAANYNSANVADANLITVVYSISGASAGNYIKPVNYTVAGTITKAAGAATSSQSGGNVTMSSKTSTTITINTVNLSSTNPGNQTPEYAISTTNTAPSTGWQDDKTFNNLTPNTGYYVFARAKENANYQAGAAKASALITTDILTTTIAFAAPLEESRVYGANFTKPLSTTGSGTGAITYSSSDTSIADVDNSGAVTIKKAGGPVTITATKTSDGTYAQATATYKLTVTQLQLTIANPAVTTTREYKKDNASAAVTAGALTNAVSGDTITVSAAGTYNSANVADAYQITVVYTISGASAANYIKPANYTTSGTITKAAGAAISSQSTLSAASQTATSITINSVSVSSSSNPGNQTAEYAVSTTNTAPTTGWQDDRTFNNLTPNTVYYLFARAKENANYLAGTAKASATSIKTNAAAITVNIVKSGNTGSDNVTASTTSGTAGTSITLNYTLANTASRNRLTFSGTTAAIAEVDSAGTGTRTYIINEADASGYVITINAAFTHSALELNTIAFANTNNEERVYGSASFTKAITNTGSGTGAISYASSDTSVATVSNTGVVTIAKVGTATITATKAADATYAQATASYTLTVTQLQLTKAAPTVTKTKTYDGNTTAAVTAVGDLNNKVGSDDVTVSAAANFNSATVADANQITVVYSISGAKAGNYIKPVDYPITTGCSITKANGGTINGTVSEASKTSTSITVSAASITSPNSGGQTVEYAVSTSTTEPTSGWKDGLTFTGLTNGGSYYIHARAKENANYKAGTAKPSAKITLSLQNNTIAFADTNNETKVYGSAAFTKAITNTGSGTGAITYSSSNTSVATVNTTTGAVTIVKVGTAVITATKAADDTYAQATASYTLTVTQLQLTKANPTVTTTKTYDGNTTAAITAVGSLNNVKSGDTVNVTAEANYNSATVAEANLITVVYTITGTNISNYIKPVDYTTTGIINKATGGTVAVPTVASKTANSITVNAVIITTNPGNQTVEYAAATGTTAPTSGWTDSTIISGLNGNTAYYLYARAKSNDNYNAGTAARSTSTTTTDLQNNFIAFDEPLDVSKVYGSGNFTKALSSTGSGNGAITYASSDTSIATVTNSGVVTLVKAGGPITISASKAANGSYSQASASYTLTITKAAGGTITSNPTVASKTSTSITVNAATITAPVNGQTVEYAIHTAATPIPTTGWQDGLTFSELTANTNYYVFARAKETTNYQAGTAKVSASIKTDAMTNTIAFPTPLEESKVYGSGTFTKALSNTGYGNGAITYTSSDTGIATVTNAGLVTLVKAGGPIIITATKAADGGYPQATATYTLTITKANGGTVSAPTKNAATSNSITVNAVTAPSTGQTVEYAYNTSTTVPTSNWQDSTTISGLTANTNYYVFARAKENDNYKTGNASSASAQIKTDAAPTAVTTKIDFEADALNATYNYTQGDNAPSSVKVVNDPVTSGKKSVQITATGYNQAVIIPIKLPYTIKDYQTFSFKFSLVSGNTGTNLDTKQIQVYVAKNSNTFVKWGFGNAASAGNQFAANLLGAAPSSAVNFDSSYVGKWTDYTITIGTPGDAIKDLTGDIFIAIGINCQNAAVYLFDDLTFTPKSGFVPPPPPPSAPTTPPSPPSTGAVSSKNYRNMFTEWGYSSADVTAKVNNAWNKLFVNGVASGDNAERIYVETGSDMAYIYTADTDDVRSEGMSYGMMMCVQMNDQARFNKLWKWARTNMYNTTCTGGNNRGYFSWQCGTNGDKKDKGPAPDGEEYFITALLFAHARWGSSSSGINNYAQEARQIIYDLTRRDTTKGDPYGEPSMFNTDNYMVRFGTLGNSATFTDPSYHLPAFYEVWALELQSDYDNSKLYGLWTDKADLKKDIDYFKQAATTSRSFFAKATNSTTGLGPDYAEFNGAATGGNHADFEYDAWRIALNIGMDYAWWAKDSWQKTFADRIQTFFEGKGVSTYGSCWTLAGSQKNADHSPGLVGCNAVASLAATNVRAWKFIEDFWNISPTTGKYRYYDGCLYMMSMLHLSGNFKVYLSSNTTPANSSSISPETATFDKKTTATNYKDIAVAVTLNGNTFSNIKNGSSTLTSGTDYSVSGTTYTIKKEYLAKQAVGTTTLTFNFSAGAAKELVVTITDSSNSSISPTTATFDKKTGAQADIAVTMTLNGNTLSNIKNGNTTLTSGTNYTTSGSTVTINKSYLSTLATGTTATLTFTFSAGATQNLVITIKDTTGGAAGTKYNFVTDNLPNGYPKYGGSGTISGEVTGGVLVVTKSGSYSTPKITLPFNISNNLSNYSGIKINVKGVSGDFGNKQLYAGVGSTNLGSVNNAPIPNGSFGDVTIPITGGTTTGDIDISFWLDNTNAYVIEIKSIELISK